MPPRELKQLSEAAVFQASSEKSIDRDDRLIKYYEALFLKQEEEEKKKLSVRKDSDVSNPESLTVFSKKMSPVQPIAEKPMKSVPEQPVAAPAALLVEAVAKDDKRIVNAKPVKQYKPRLPTPPSSSDDDSNDERAQRLKKRRQMAIMMGVGEEDKKEVPAKAEISPRPRGRPPGKQSHSPSSVIIKNTGNRPVGRPPGRPPGRPAGRPPGRPPVEISDKKRKTDFFEKPIESRKNQEIRKTPPPPTAPARTRNLNPTVQNLLVPPNKIAVSEGGPTPDFTFLDDSKKQVWWKQPIQLQKIYSELNSESLAPQPALSLLTPSLPVDSTKLRQAPREWAKKLADLFGINK